MKNRILTIIAGIMFLVFILAVTGINEENIMPNVITAYISLMYLGLFAWINRNHPIDE